MDPATLIPTPDKIPVAWGWLQFLLTLTFYLHILAMNIMLGTVIIAFVHHFSTEGESLPVTREISKKLPYAIALTVNLGIAPFLFAQVIYGHFLYVSSVLMGVFWLSVIALLIVAYYSAYIYYYRYQTMRAGRMVTSGITMFSLLCISFFFSNNVTMMLHPESWIRYFKHPDGFLLNLADPTLIPRYLHFVTSAIAVGGLAIALFYTYQASRGKEGSDKWVKYGCNWFSGATIINFALGFWFFGSLQQKGLINPSTLIGGLFALFLVIAIITAVLSVISAMRYRPVPAAYLLLATVLFMVFMRDLLTLAYLKPWFFPTELTVQTQWSPFLLFALVLIGGLALVGWMLKTTFTATQDKEVRS